MESKPTPLVDAALEEAMRRLYHTQQFEKGGIPKEFADFARRLERALAVAEEHLSRIANFTTGYADVAGIVNIRARAALAQIEEIRR